ncbi:MAG TPA: hypothetical protein PLP22_10600 [Candidatus Competibacter sp.]|nr:hypothetical protein [Candidatus Competibacteraceae bacterium]HRE55226.1 hypothetical protein [Candidatus Competibacter sp.]HUM96110.1 hypothetical protein [Candidatus Competibacter sp.]
MPALPDLSPAEIRRLFDRAEQDRAAHPHARRTVIHHRGHRFTVDASPIGLRLWFRKTLLARRYGFGL